MDNKELINISEKLKGYTPDTIHLYSPVFGTVVVRHVDGSRIKCYVENDKSELHIINFDVNGHLQAICSDCYITGWSDEVMLFPSSDNRDWTTFELGECRGMPDSWDSFLKVAKDVPAVEYEGRKVSSQYPRLMILEKLLLIRDYYNSGWTPDFKDNDNKWQIVCDYNQVEGCRVIGFEKHVPRVLTFKDERLAEKFIRCFEDMIKEVKEFL